MATPAERQRRRRAHAKGDHSLCIPDSCPAAEQRHAGSILLASEGAAVLRQLDVNSLPPTGQLLAIQAAKAADRIAWLEGEMAAGTGDALRLLDAMARQVTLMKGLLSELRNWTPEPESAEAKEDALDELARLRKERFSAAAGQ